MATSAGRAKRDREKARQERQLAKRERRQAAHDLPPEEAPRGAARLGEDEVLARLADLHRRFADEQIGFDEFEQTKADLLAQLEV